MKTYLLTPKDVQDYHDGRNGIIDQIWWEVLNTLPLELFKEAITKGFTLLNKTDAHDTTKKEILLTVPNATPELNKAIEEIDMQINFIS